MKKNNREIGLGIAIIIFTAFMVLSILWSGGAEY